MYRGEECTIKRVHFMERHAKLDGVVLYGDVHPSTVIHLVNCTCENLQGGRNPSIIKNLGPIIIIRRTCAGLQVSIYLPGKNAKLGGVVLFVDTHPSTNIQSVKTIPVKIDGRQQQEQNRRKPGINVYTRRTCAGLQVQYLQEKKCEAGWCGAFCRYAS